MYEHAFDPTPQWNAPRRAPVRTAMEIDDALTFVRDHKHGVLTTLKADGRPQLSNILFAVDGDRIRISVTADRAKARNAARDPRVSLHVTSQDFYAYVVVEADAELSPVPAAPDDATVDELVELYRSMVGEHPDWDDYRASMVRDQRLVLRLHPTRAYGMLRLPTP
jgi:PPOX class probable F420-dependent enzyme